jgi:hypothetical protein
VDPGVGTARKAIAMRCNNRTYIAPDNGVLSLVTSPETVEVEIRELSNPRLWLANPSHTFHGRDLFAPAAAHLAAGNLNWESIGPPIDHRTVLPNLRPNEENTGRWSGIALHIDRFGNIITNFSIQSIVADFKPLTIQLNGHRIRRFQRTFGENDSDGPFLYAGSSGYVEVAINRGNAAAVLGTRAGDSLLLEFDA